MPQGPLARKKRTLPFRIQTLTVGTGITPVRAQRLADYHRRWGISPRPKGYCI